jgi:hypothetical protein
VVTRPVLDLQPGDQVRQPSGAWLTVGRRPRPSRTGAVLTWLYLGGGVGQAGWLDHVECRPTTPMEEAHMARRMGIVADATAAVLAEKLGEEMRGLPECDVKRIAARQVEALREAGWRITAPAAALARTRSRTGGGAR